MIHADMEQEYLEFEGNGETLLQEMAMVMSMSLIESVHDDKHPMPIELVPDVVDKAMEVLGELVKLAVTETVKETMEYEEEKVNAKRGNETIRTTVKQFRRRTTS